MEDKKFTSGTVTVNLPDDTPDIVLKAICFLDSLSEMGHDVATKFDETPDSIIAVVDGKTLRIPKFIIDRAINITEVGHTTKGGLRS